MTPCEMGPGTSDQLHIFFKKKTNQRNQTHAERQVRGEVRGGHREVVSEAGVGVGGCFLWGSEHWEAVGLSQEVGGGRLGDGGLCRAMRRRDCGSALGRAWEDLGGLKGGPRTVRWLDFGGGLGPRNAQWVVVAPWLLGRQPTRRKAPAPRGFQRPASGLGQSRHIQG